MFTVGDTVMHPSEGICTVEAIRPIAFSGKARDYYVLRPSMEKSSSIVYIPVERGDAILRRLLSRQDILSLIHRSADCPSVWVEDSRLRRDAFQRIMAEGDHVKIIRMISDLHAHREKRVSEGKKPCASDETLLGQAERLVHQEFSYVLHMSVEETVAFIRSELSAL